MTFVDVASGDPTIQLTGARGVLVTDAEGGQTLVGFRANGTGEVLFVEERSNLDVRAPGSGFPGADDPFGWRTYFTLNGRNLLPDSTFYRTSTSGLTWASEPALEKETWAYYSTSDPDSRL